jgi:hypothetical protein
MEVKVIDSMTGRPVPSAYVYVDFSGDSPKLFNANGNGIATVIAPAGNYNISTYKTDYLPAYDADGNEASITDLQIRKVIPQLIHMIRTAIC